MANARESGGLDGATAAARLLAEGYNEIPSPERRRPMRILSEVAQEPMFLLLVGGGLVYLLLGDRVEALMLIAFAALSVGITIAQEMRSERVLEALRKLASPRALVVRNGIACLIPGREVVRGDLIMLAEGDRIAADAAIVWSDDLLVDESLLTGESVPIRKNAPDAGAPDGTDDASRVQAGTLVVRGSAAALVQETGPLSQMGRIGRSLSSIEPGQPRLQRQMRWLVRDFAIAGAIAGATAVALFGILRGSWLNALLGGIALGMSLLPEEFPLVVAVFMAMGAWRISRARVLTRRAAAIETLGSTTVLCTDKTGTLTENRMRVTTLDDTGHRWRRGRDPVAAAAASAALRAAAAACGRQSADPMDTAIRSLAEEVAAGAGAPVAADTIVRAYGLRPDLFVVANVVAGADGSTRAYAKGAPEAIAELCRMAAPERTAIMAEIERQAAAGQRMLGVAQGVPLDAFALAGLPETPRGFALSFVGLIGFSDPLRAHVPDAIAECRSAGVRVVMITGDHPATAMAIAREAGIDTDTVLTGATMASLSHEALARQAGTVTVFARIRPEQKLSIVQILQARGEVVAMTGDGVNDAPAIKAADIGIAMGDRGTDVAREASDIVLLDDDFGSIVRTIRLGRRIYDNLRKAIEFIVAVHIPMAGIALLPLLLGLPVMLGPIHIAFLEMIIDPACSVVLEAEEEEADVMRRPPRDPASPLLLPRRIAWAVIQGLVALAVVGAVLVIGARRGMPEGELRALVFTLLVLLDVALILVNRSFDASLARAFTRSSLSLRLFFAAIALLLGVALFVAPVRSLFHFGALRGDELAWSGLAALAALLVLEHLKAWLLRAPAGWHAGGAAPPSTQGR